MYRVFVFQEGSDRIAETAFKEVARLSKGAWFRFDRNSAATLAKLLSAVAVFATGGLKALEARDRPEDRLMIESLRAVGPDERGARHSCGFACGIGLTAAFLRVDAARLAAELRLAGPTVLGAFGVLLTIIGRAAFGGMLLSGAIAWYGLGGRWGAW